MFHCRPTIDIKGKGKRTLVRTIYLIRKDADVFPDSLWWISGGFCHTAPKPVHDGDGFGHQEPISHSGSSVHYRWICSMLFSFCPLLLIVQINVSLPSIRQKKVAVEMTNDAENEPPLDDAKGMLNFLFTFSPCPWCRNLWSRSAASYGLASDATRGISPIDTYFVTLLTILFQFHVMLFCFSYFCISFSSVFASCCKIYVCKKICQVSSLLLLSIYIYILRIVSHSYRTIA